MELIERNLNGEEFYQTGKATFLLKKCLAFQTWIEKKYGSYQQFLNLKDSDKEKLFLRWKWGLSDDNANHNLEHTRRYIMANLEDVEQLPEDIRDYYRIIKRFEDYCYSIKQEIGLAMRKEDEDFISRARDIFGGDNQ